VHGTEVVFINRGADSLAQVRAGLLVCSKVDAALDARVRDVVVISLNELYCKTTLGTVGFVNVIEWPSSRCTP
jgi:hypothetical protein